MKPFVTDPQTLQSQIDQEQFSGVVYMTFEGSPVVKIAAGFADREHRIPNKIDTKFNLGSNSKMFTAVAIAQLAQKGQLHFSDTLGKHLKDYPNPEARNITIHQLLTHTGGTGDIFGPDFDANLEKLKNPSDYINLYGHRKLEFVSGSRFAYSNYGFILLGAIIETVSMQSYYDYIRQSIYQIASMNSSDSYWKTDCIPNMAIGYIKTNPSHFQPNQSLLPLRGTPTGGQLLNSRRFGPFCHSVANASPIECRIFEACDNRQSRHPRWSKICLRI